MEPPVARPERNVGVRAERAVVVVAERMERRLRDISAPCGEDDGRRTLLRNIRRLRTLLAISEQGLRCWPAQASAGRLQEFFVFGDQGRAGRLLEELRDALWWEAVADGAGYMSGADQGEHQRHVALVFGQMERHPASRFESFETARRNRDHPVQLLVGGCSSRTDEGGGFRSSKGRRLQRTGYGWSLVSHGTMLARASGCLLRALPRSSDRGRRRVSRRGSLLAPPVVRPGSLCRGNWLARLALGGYCARG